MAIKFKEYAFPAGILILVITALFATMSDAGLEPLTQAVFYVIGIGLILRGR